METSNDIDFSNMSKEEALKLYVENIMNLEKIAKRRNINKDAFKEYVFQQFYFNNSYWSYKCLLFYKICSRFILKFLISYKTYFILFLTGVLLQLFKNEGQALFIRKIQTYIYPFMRILRKIAIPLLYFFPKITSLYEETCLVSNPYFQTNQIDCSGCQHINIIDLSNQDHLVKIYNNFPFLINMDESAISIQDIYGQIRKLQLTEKSSTVETLAEAFHLFFNNSNDNRHHSIWKCNTMNCARLLRKLLPRPKQIPKEMSISVNRFLIFDSKDWPAYRVPDGECDMSFIFQVSGSRKIVLTPNLKCVDVCKKLTINLPEKHTLFYNWWYYDAISVPNYQPKHSIIYVASYC